MTNHLAIAPTDYEPTCYRLAQFLADNLNALRPDTVVRFEDFDSQIWQEGDFPLLKVFKLRWQGFLGSESLIRILYVTQVDGRADFNWVVLTIFRLLEVFSETSDCLEIDIPGVVAKYQVVERQVVYPFVQFDLRLKERF